MAKRVYVHTYYITTHRHSRFDGGAVMESSDVRGQHKAAELHAALSLTGGTEA